MSLNNSGDRVTFVNPPAAVSNSLGLSLRTAFPHRIDNEQNEDGIFTIILKSGINRTHAFFILAMLYFNFFNCIFFSSSVMVAL